MKHRATVIAGCVLLAGGASAGAQELGDPTRPPDAREAEAPASSSFGPVLQSIVLSPDRRFAVIDGQTVKVGDTFRSARVIAIDVDSVRLRAEDGVTVMKLLPGTEKDASKSRISPVQPAKDNRR